MKQNYIRKMYLINSCSLWSSTRHDLLRDTDAAAAHADPQAVHTRVNQILGLRGCHYVTADHLQTISLSII